MKALGHPNLAVRTRATNVLASRGEGVVKRVKHAVGNPEEPLACDSCECGCCTVSAQLEETDLKAAALADDPRVRVHAMRVLAERPELEGETARDWPCRPSARRTPLVRRCAAGALGQHPQPDNLRPLLDARHAADPADTHLVHVDPHGPSGHSGGGFGLAHAGRVHRARPIARPWPTRRPGCRRWTRLKYLLGYLPTAQKDQRDVVRYVALDRPTRQ